MTPDAIVAVLLASGMVLVLLLCVGHWVVTEVPMSGAGLHSLTVISSAIIGALAGWMIGRRK